MICRLTLLVSVLIFATVADATPTRGQQIALTLMRPFRSTAAQAIKRQAVRVTESPVGKTFGKGWRFISTLDKRALAAGKRVAASKRRKNALAFDSTVLGLREIPATIVVGNQRAKTRGSAITLGQAELTELSRAYAPLIDGMTTVGIKIIDPETGEKRHATPEEIRTTREVITALIPALASHKLQLTLDTNSLHAILNNPVVAAALFRGCKSPATEFLNAYRTAISTINVLSDAYSIFLHWPGKREDKRLRSLATDESLLLVAARRRAPIELVAATRVLTQEHFGKITHLWLDPLLSGDGKTDAQLKARIKDDNAHPLFDQLVKFRDTGALMVVAMSQGERRRDKEDQLRTSLKSLSRETAGRTLRTDYFARASDETRDGFLNLILAGTVIGFGIDGAAHASGNATILKWKPSILGGWDDAVGGWVNGKELKENGHKGAMLDVGIATVFGFGTSLALGIDAVSGQSMASLMLNTSTDLAPRMLASGLYGVASSGGTLAMSFLPSRHYYRPILDLVAEGKIDRPADGSGNELSGWRLKAWARRESLRAHLAYTAQKGGLIGVGLSGVLTAGFGILPGWGGPAAANILLSIGGAAETITTGVYLHLREGIDRRSIDKAAERELSQLAGKLRD